jgi:branched-chain amino acid transport system substrate-binding protein
MKRAIIWIGVLTLALFPMTSFGSEAPVVIGAVQPLTGWASLDGLNTVAGLKIAVAQINAEGGVLGGRPLKLIIKDGKADPVESVNAVQDLINHDKVPAIIGCWASSATLAAMPIVKQNHIPLLVATSTAPLITEQKNKWVFRFTSNNDIDGALMAKYLVPKLGFKKSAYLAVNNDWGRSMAKAVSEIMKKTGGKVIMVEYCPGNETDFTPLLTRIKNSDADSMFITTSYTGASLIMKQYHELGMHKKVFITSGLSAERMIKLDGKKIMDGVYFFERYVPSSPPKGTEAQNKWLLAKYKELYPNGVADMYVAFGYDAVHIMADAINRAGKVNSAAIRNALQKTDYLGLTGRVKFDANNDSQPRCSITQVKNGVNVIVYHLNNK